MGVSGRVALCVLLCAGCFEHESDRTSIELENCSTCHIDEYQVAPDHVDSYPTTCVECHAITAWAPSIFSHETATSACYACHRKNYEGTTDPVHPGTKPTTCDDCHTTNAWRPALDGIHPESRFPINNGPHENVACTDCHDPARGSSLGGENTDCVGCHTGEHSMSRVNGQHREVGDYRFEPDRPNFCLDCHPAGRHD